MIGAKPRNETRYPWHPAMLRKMLTFDYYWTGKHKVKWDGVVYEIPMPIIIPEDLAHRVMKRKAQYKQYPAGRLRENYLAAGLVYCLACGTRCNVCSQNNGIRKDGTQKKYIYYQCNNRYCRNSDCFGRCSANKIDARIWAKVWKYISDPVEFEATLNKRIDQLQAEEYDAEFECERLERNLREYS